MTTPPHHPDPFSDQADGSTPDPLPPDSSSSLEEALRRAGAEAPVELDLGARPDDHFPYAATGSAHMPGRVPPSPPPTSSASFTEERSFVYYEKQPPGGRHLASRKVQGRSPWMLAPGGLALAALVLFVAALLGNLGPERLQNDGDASREATAQPQVQAQGQGEQQPAVDQEEVEEAAAKEAAAEQEAAEQAATAAAQQIQVDNVQGEQLGDIVTYADGMMGCVARTSHTDAGQGLAEVSLKIKFVNAGTQPVDASTARVELAFASQSSRATQVSEEGLGVVPPNEGEAVGEWRFRLPADQIDDISVTLAPTDQHKPVVFHGASR